MAHPPITPFIPSKIQIDNAVSYRNFFKKNYKLVQITELKFFHSALGNHTRTKMIVKKLAKVSKKAKQMQGLLLHRCNLYHHKQTDPQFFSIIKRFSNLRFLSLNFNGGRQDRIQNYTKWLQSAKRLTKFYFMYRKYTHDPYPEHLKKQFSSFIRVLKWKRLEVLKIFLRGNNTDTLQRFLEFKNYFPTIQKLSIVWKPYEDPLLISAQPLENLSMAHLKNLNTLNIFVPITVPLLKSALDTILYPSNLKVLGLEPQGESTNFNADSLSLTSILQKFSQIKKLRLLMNMWLDIPKSLVNATTLEHFKLEFYVQKMTDLAFLGELLNTLQCLQSLVLTLRTKQALEVEPGSNFYTLLNDISQIKNLYKFKFYSYGLAQNKSIENNEGVISSLASCIQNMPDLQEFSVRFHQSDSVQEYHQLIEALMAKAKDLKRLRIDFSAQKLERQGRNKLLGLLKRLESLEVLGLHNLWLEGLIDFERLAECLELLPNLQVMNFYQLNGNVYRAPLARFMKRLLVRRGFRKIQCTQCEVNTETLGKEIDNSDKLDVKEIVKTNIGLQLAYTPFDIYVSSSEVNFYKWII